MESTNQQNVPEEIGTVININEVDQEGIRQTYQRLIASFEKPIDADETIKNDIEKSRNFDKEFCCSDPFYKEQIETIKLSKPDNITMGTVGSYLYGCFQPEIAIEVACTPACSSGLRNPDIEPCDVSSYYKSQDKLTKINDIKTEDANLFLSEGQEITAADREILKNDGVKIVTIYKQDNNSLNYVLGETINLEEPEPTPPPPPPPPPPSSNAWWGWVFFALFIIIVIGLAIFLLR